MLRVTAREDRRQSIGFIRLTLTYVWREGVTVWKLGARAYRVYLVKLTLIYHLCTQNVENDYIHII